MDFASEILKMFKKRPHIVLMIGWILIMLIGVILNRELMAISIIFGVVILGMELHVDTSSPDEDEDEVTKIVNAIMHDSYMNVISKPDITDDETEESSVDRF